MVAEQGERSILRMAIGLSGFIIIMARHACHVRTG